MQDRVKCGLDFGGGEAITCVGLAGDMVFRWMGGRGWHFWLEERLNRRHLRCHSHWVKR